MIYIVDAILAIKPNIGVTVKDEDIDNIVWDNANDIISKADILAKKTELETAYDAKQYQRDRVYPSIGDQLDMLWHSIDQNPALKSQYFNFYEAIKAVKVKNPK